MKNYEKFQDTHDAMNAYNRYSMSCSDVGCHSVGFMEWCNRDVVEKMSLLDAAKQVLRDTTQANLESLRNAVKDEIDSGKTNSCKTNFSRYDDAESAVEAFLDRCDNQDCKDCEFKGSSNCIASWLYSKDV